MDIQSVLCLGDGLMAGFGARRNKDIRQPGLFSEDLGTSFFCGGDPGVPTVANFLRHHRPDLVGLSRGSRPVMLCPDGWCKQTLEHYSPVQNLLNAAFSGGTVGDLGLQLNYLRDTLKATRKDLLDQWKLLAILIGETDLCRNLCKNELTAVSLGKHFTETLRRSLQRIERTFPKTLAVLFLLPEMTLLDWYTNLHPRCRAKREQVYNICPCAFDAPEKYLRAREAFNAAILALKEEFNTPANPSFAVTVIPCLKETVMRGPVKNDRSLYTSKDDCFHPSVDAHSLMAHTTWRSLFLPLEERSTNLCSKLDKDSPAEEKFQLK